MLTRHQKSREADDQFRHHPNEMGDHFHPDFRRQIRHL